MLASAPILRKAFLDPGDWIGKAAVDGWGDRTELWKGRAGFHGP